jgi:histone deacetylase HOS3
MVSVLNFQIHILTLFLAAFQRHGIKRIVILDIDLHHGMFSPCSRTSFGDFSHFANLGNGTQSIAMKMNELAYNSSSAAPRMFYGSVHDIMSYPYEVCSQETIMKILTICQDPDLDDIMRASSCIDGNRGQFIHNVALEPWVSEEHFWAHDYPQKYMKIISQAQSFLDKTGGPGKDVLIFIRHVQTIHL